MQSDAGQPLATDRTSLRSQLLARRDQFVGGPDFVSAELALAQELVQVLRQLEPGCLGIYSPVRSEFNAVQACAADPGLSTTEWALPFCLRSPRSMRYQRWNKRPPTLRDESGIGSADGPPVVPDVILVPCLGFTEQGFRLGYGAGYFDRWQADHPEVCAIGVAWSVGRLAAGDFEPQPHDQRLMLVVTEQGVVGN